ncbi:hypothetical protein [Mycolicibacterium sp. 120270]|uniref:hypothetical protein n=1 Tax=Mycolicibacterium sp. 120270 TaxID=3090600 RepID=UPI00299DE5C6|nr:hypothetical protein [Mycolicibacterium sp. 120270]MDX1881865.1 hypothetical protein [Mycolicibacterium sp. 120270]
MPQYMGIDHREWARTCKCGGPLDWEFVRFIESYGGDEKKAVFKPVCVNRCRGFTRADETGQTAKHIKVSAAWQPHEGGPFGST